MKIEKFVLGPVFTNSFIIYDEHSKECAIIDPADDGPIIWKYIIENNLTPKYILLTHGHFDHIGAVAFLKRKINIPCLIHKDDLDFVINANVLAGYFGLRIEKPPKPDRFISDGDKIKLGDYIINVLHTPGHSQGSVSFFIPKEKAVFSGDLIFRRNIGRVDLPGGDFNTLINSVKSKIFPLGDDVKIFPGHEGNTTVGEEKRFNPYFRGM